MASSSAQLSAQIAAKQEELKNLTALKDYSCRLVSSLERVSSQLDVILQHNAGAFPSSFLVLLFDSFTTSCYPSSAHFSVVSVVVCFFPCSRACCDRAVRADARVDGADERRDNIISSINSDQRWRRQGGQRQCGRGANTNSSSDVRANAAERNAAISHARRIGFSFGFIFRRSRAPHCCWWIARVLELVCCFCVRCFQRHAIG